MVYPMENRGDRGREATSLLSAIETRESIDVCRSIPAAGNRISKMNFIWPGTNTEHSFLSFFFPTRKRPTTLFFNNKRIMNFESNSNNSNERERERERESKVNSRFFFFDSLKKFQRIFHITTT